MTATATGAHDCPMCCVANKRGRAIFDQMVELSWTQAELELLRRLTFDMED